MGFELFFDINIFKVAASNTRKPSFAARPQNAGPRFETKEA